MLGGTRYEISVDDGLNYQDITKDQRIDLDDTGTQLKIRVTINSSSTRIASLAVLVK